MVSAAIGRVKRIGGAEGGRLGSASNGMLRVGLLKKITLVQILKTSAFQSEAIAGPRP